MKRIVIIMAVLTIACSHVAMTQVTSKENQLSKLLSGYYSIKDALVSGNTSSASVNAEAFTKIANTIDYKIISEGNISSLVQDAEMIAANNDIKKQRAVFANFSKNMATVAKAVKLSDQAVYLQYCPMKKASWLSNEKTIKNPYFGSAMLSCGELTDTY
jgi:hypothetical protein